MVRPHLVSADQSGHACYRLGIALSASLPKPVTFQRLKEGKRFILYDKLGVLDLIYEKSTTLAALQLLVPLRWSAT